MDKSAAGRERAKDKRLPAILEEAEGKMDGLIGNIKELRDILETRGEIEADRSAAEDRVRWAAAPKKW